MICHLLTTRNSTAWWLRAWPRHPSLRPSPCPRKETWALSGPTRQEGRGFLLSPHEPPGAGTWTAWPCPGHPEGQASLARSQIKRETNQSACGPGSGYQSWFLLAFRTSGPGRGPHVLPMDTLIYLTQLQVNSGPDNLNSPQLSQERALISRWWSLLIWKMEPMRLRHTPNETKTHTLEEASRSNHRDHKHKTSGYGVSCYLVNRGCCYHWAKA